MIQEPFIARMGHRVGRRAARVVVLTAVLLFSGFNGRASGQTPGAVVVRDADEVASIELVRFARITESGPGANPLGRIVVHGEQLYVIDLINRTEVNVFDVSGKHLRRIGREGEGPGEFRNTVWIELYADSLFVYDNALRRESVFSLSDGTFLRQRPVLGRFFRGIPFGQGRVVANAIDTSPDRIGAPFHVIGSDGTVVRSFPNQGGRFRADQAGLLMRPIVRSGEARFWSALRTEYVLEEWDLDGRRLGRLDRFVPWFAPHQQLTPYRPGVEPLPRIWDLHTDAMGRIWVLIHVAASGWAAEFRSGVPEDMAFNGNHAGYWDSVIEVIDPQQGEVVARYRSDHYFQRFTNRGQLVAYGEGPSGLPFLDVWDLHIVRGSPPRGLSRPRG